MTVAVEVSKTQVLRFIARIGDHTPSIAMAEVKQAVAPRVPIDDGLLLSLEPQDGSAAMYQQAADVITRKVPGFVEHRVAASETNHLSVFGFAPMPLLMLLGRSIGDKHPAEVYERHRHSDSWRWDEEGPALEWSATFPARPVRGRAVALLLSISASVAVDGVRGALGGDFDIIEFGLPRSQRVPNIVRTRAQLRGFAEQWRATLNRIKEDHEPAQIHIFPAAPLSVCIELGRRALPKADPELVLYDYFVGQFRRALSLGGPEGPTPAAKPSTSLDWRMGLMELFVSAFENFELRLWLDQIEADLSNFLGSPNQLSRQEFAGAACRRLENRGVIDDVFFTRLGAHFSHESRKNEVERIRRAWADARKGAE